jgi:hypothetical protein
LIDSSVLQEKKSNIAALNNRKMKTALKISICLLLFNSVSFAQKGSWTIGLASGMRALQ